MIPKELFDFDNYYYEVLGEDVSLPFWQALWELRTHKIGYYICRTTKVSPSSPFFSKTFLMCKSFFRRKRKIRSEYYFSCYSHYRPNDKVPTVYWDDPTIPLQILETVKK
jgi:hypothetical protein